MEERSRPSYAERAQRLADLQEHLDLLRYPARLAMLRAVDEAAQRADCLARLDELLDRVSALR